MENEKPGLVYPVALILGGGWIVVIAISVALGFHHFPTWVQVMDSVVIGLFLIILGIGKLREREGQIR